MNDDEDWTFQEVSILIKLQSISNTGSLRKWM